MAGRVPTGRVQQVEIFNPPPTPIFAGFVTNAVANTPQSDVLLAAPGAGLRYRIVTAWLCLDQNEPAANVFRFLWNNLAGQYYWATTCQITTVPRDAIVLPAPGIYIATNGSIQIDEVCNAAARPYTAGVSYYIDVA